MTTGFDHQAPSYGPILKTTPNAPTVGARLKPPARAEDRPLEPRSFSTRTQRQG
jgi:hypothetical protein